MGDIISEKNNDIDHKIVLERKNKPLLISYPNVFTKETQEYLLSLLMFKNNIEWEIYTSEEDRYNIAFVESVWSKYKYNNMEIKPYLIKKHSDIFKIIYMHIKDIIHHMIDNTWILPLEFPNYWIGNLYKEDTMRTSENEIGLVKGSPIIIINLGADRKLKLYSNKKDMETTIELKSGMVCVMLSPISKHYKYSIIQENDNLYINLMGLYLSTGKYAYI